LNISFVFIPSFDKFFFDKSLPLRARTSDPDQGNAFSGQAVRRWCLLCFPDWAQDLLLVSRSDTRPDSQEPSGLTVVDLFR